MNGAQVRVQRLGRTRPNPIATAGIALLGVAAGLALVNASMGPLHPERGTVVDDGNATQAPTAREAEPEDEAMPSEAAPVAAVSPEAAMPVAAMPVAATPTAVTPTAAMPSAATPSAVTPSAATPSAATPRPATPAAAGDLHMRRGRMAYIRCASGASPCPRDLALEESVWSALSGLSSCGGLRVGASDVRLLMSPGAAPELSFRDLPGDAPALDTAALSACLEAPLSRLRTTLSETHYVVSFRFQLEAP